MTTAAVMTALLVSACAPLAPFGGVYAVRLEVLESHIYQPPWQVNEPGNQNDPKWSSLSWDKEREQRCKSLLRPENPRAAGIGSWYLFVNDPTGTKRIKYAHWLCESDVVWSIDYVAFDYTGQRPILLSKFTVRGDLIYAATIDRANELSFIRGMTGAIMPPSLKVQDGYVTFDFWNTNQSGSDRFVYRTMKIRFREPNGA